MALQRADREDFWYRFAVGLLRPLMRAVTRQDWRGAEHLPRSGGVVVCVNHISYLDPLSVAHFLHDSGRAPRFLAKESLFRVPVVGRILHGAGQIPVHRNSSNAALALGDAVAAVRRGECVVVYPESTITRDPGLWPMVGKTGAARIALSTGAPLVPVAQWGAHELLAPYDKRLRLLPRKTMRIVAGPPLDLSAYAGGEPAPDALRRVSDDLMAEITRLLAGIRGETPPAERFDLRRSA